jgi:hypothetical protein
MKTAEALPKINFGEDRELEELYSQLTPENKIKFINKYFELLREQEAQEAQH